MWPTLSVAVPFTVAVSPNSELITVPPAVAPTTATVSPAMLEIADCPAASAVIVAALVPKVKAGKVPVPLRVASLTTMLLSASPPVEVLVTTTA